MEALRRVIRSACRASESTGKRGGGVVNRILGICQTAPVGAVDEEDGHWERCHHMSGFILRHIQC